MPQPLRILLLAALAALAAAAEPEPAFPGYAPLHAKARSLWTGRNAAGGAYVVLVPENSPLRKAAETLAAYRNAVILPYSPAAPEDCLPDLIAKNARHAAIFVEPRDMDVNLLRRFIVISTLLDQDPFCDVAFGFVTASTPRKVEEFVGRMIAADRDGVPSRTLQISSSNISARYDSSFIPGLPGESWYVNFGDLAQAREALAHVGEAGFVHVGGCSDPEGVWLFDDARNGEADKHWPFDPKRVGEDPKGEMPRITAAEFRKAKFANAVVWTHACHLGAVSRVYVEPDIVSTFGETEKLEAYTIPAGRSVALAILDGGAGAYICPIGANFGAQADLEQDLAAELGLPLGDVLRRGYHDIVMDSGGHPEQIGVFVPGTPKFVEPDAFVNNNAPHHRVLYGDPLLAPFAKRKLPSSVAVTAAEKPDGVRITFRTLATGWEVGRTWWGNRGRAETGRSRFYEEIPLSHDVAEGWISAIRTRRADGSTFAVTHRSVLVEKIDGRTVLHVQIVSPDLVTLEWGGGGGTYELPALMQEGAEAEVVVTFGKRPEGAAEAEPAGLDRPTAEPPPAAPAENEPVWGPPPAAETPALAARLKALLAEHRRFRGPTESVDRGRVVLDIGRLRTPAALRALLGFLADDKDPYVRTLLAGAIADVDGREAAAALLAALPVEADAAVRGAIRAAIVHSLDAREAAEALRRGLQHREPAARAAAAAALGRLRWAGALDALLQSTKDADPATRLAAIEALRGFTTPEALDTLLRLAAGEDEAARAALWALDEGGSDDERVLELARRILDSSKPASLRAPAARLLGARRDAAALKPLLKALTSRDWPLRAAAVAALAQLRHRDAVEPLIARLEAEDGRLAADVAAALARITGVAIGTDAKKWREWWRGRKDTFQPPPEKEAVAGLAEGMTEVAYHDIPIVSRRIVFVLDISASMAEPMGAAVTRSGADGGPAGSTRLDFCKWELARTIRRLPKEVRFNIVTFGTAVHGWKPGLAPVTPAARADALAFVERQVPEGATNLHGALERAFEDRDADTFYVLSDGQPTDGAITAPAELLAWVRRVNAGRGIVIHTVSAGELAALSDNLLRRMAEENGGKSVVLK